MHFFDYYMLLNSSLITAFGKSHDLHAHHIIVNIHLSPRLKLWISFHNSIIMQISKRNVLLTKSSKEIQRYIFLLFTCSRNGKK